MSTDSQHHKDQLQVTVLAILMAVLLGGGWLMSGLLVREVPPLVIAGGRTAASAMVLTAVVAARSTHRSAAATAGRRGRAVVSLAFLGLFAYSLGTLIGVEKLGASQTNVIVAFLPGLTFIVGVVGFGERATPRKFIGTAVAAFGAATYALQFGGGAGGDDVAFGERAFGFAVALAATVGFALYGYLYRRKMADIPSISSLPAITGAATVMFAVAMAATGQWSGLTLRQWVAVAILGVLFVAPIYVISHELVVRRGPLVPAVSSLVAPFLVRIGEWLLGLGPAPDVVSIGLLALCAGGMWATITSVPPPRPGTDSGPGQCPGPRHAWAPARGNRRVVGVSQSVVAGRWRPPPALGRPGRHRRED